MARPPRGEEEEEEHEGRGRGSGGAPRIRTGVRLAQQQQQLHSRKQSKHLTVRPRPAAAAAAGRPPALPHPRAVGSGSGAGIGFGGLDQRDVLLIVLFALVAVVVVVFVAVGILWTWRCVCRRGNQQQRRRRGRRRPGMQHADTLMPDLGILSPGLQTPVGPSGYASAMPYGLGSPPPGTFPHGGGPPGGTFRALPATLHPTGSPAGSRSVVPPFAPGAAAAAAVPAPSMLTFAEGVGHDAGVAAARAASASGARAVDRSQGEIAHEELTFIEEVGSGASGVVYKGLWRGGVVALKKLITERTLTEKELEDFRKEAALMHALRPHVNVVQFLGLCPQEMVIVTEFLEHGSLHSLLHEKSTEISTELLKTVVSGSCAGMLHLHAENIVHRDLAARNVLLGAGMQCKISDFGLSRTYNSEVESANVTKSDVGPLKWMSPEAIRGRVYSFQSDVWSFGVLLWEVASRSNPYPNQDPVQTAIGVVGGTLRLQAPADCPPILAQLMRSCMRTRPQDRLSFSEINSAIWAADDAAWTRPSQTLDHQHQQQQQQHGQEGQQTNVAVAVDGVPAPARSPPPAPDGREGWGNGGGGGGGEGSGGGGGESGDGEGTGEGSFGGPAFA